MSLEEAKEQIKGIPIGSDLQLIRKSGVISDVKLASDEIEAVKAKDYGHLQIPCLPPALLVTGNARFGKYRVEIGDIVRIAWVG